MLCKVHFIPLHFYKKPTAVPVSLTKRNLKRVHLPEGKIYVTFKEQQKVEFFRRNNRNPESDLQGAEEKKKKTPLTWNSVPRENIFQG